MTSDTAGELLDTGEIARRLGVTRPHLTDRLSKRPDFPPPAVNISRKIRRWRAADIERWMLGQSSRRAIESVDSLK